MIVMFKESWSPAVTSNPEKHLIRGGLRSHWVKWLLCSHYDSHQEERTLEGQEIHVEVTHVFMIPSTIIAWFSTVWGISNFLRQFSGPKTYRANRDRKKRGRKKTQSYLHFSVLLTRAGHIFKTHLQNEYSFPLFTFKILHAALYPPCCSLCSANHNSSSEQPSLLRTSTSLPPIQLQIGLNH